MEFPIEDVSTLSRLRLESQEIDRYAQELGRVLEYIGSLQVLDVADVPETHQVTGLFDVWREDEVHSSGEEKREALIALFPERAGRWLKVRAVFGDR